jgi:TDG/mug DNA glycosylase family protein
METRRAGCRPKRAVGNILQCGVQQSGADFLAIWPRISAGEAPCANSPHESMGDFPRASRVRDCYRRLLPHDASLPRFAPVTPQSAIGEQPATLPDLLRGGLDVVFVGINPGLYSARQGHYFARRTNRFWPAFSRSILSAAARRSLGVLALVPEHDAALLDHGFGFTDVVKRPTGNAAQLQPGELAAAAPLLLEKLAAHQPRVACFHGLTGYRPFARTVFGDATNAPALGIQSCTIGAMRFFVAPNPSPANAHFTLADQADWYDRLAGFLTQLPAPS